MYYAYQYNGSAVGATLCLYHRTPGTGPTLSTFLNPFSFGMVRTSPRTPAVGRNTQSIPLRTGPVFVLLGRRLYTSGMSGNEHGIQWDISVEVSVEVSVSVTVPVLVCCHPSLWTIKANTCVF